jgi:hypothetical protein
MSDTKARVVKAIGSGLAVAGVVTVCVAGLASGAFLISFYVFEPINVWKGRNQAQMRMYHAKENYYKRK